MSDKFEKPEIKKTALNNIKLSLSAPCPTAPGKFSYLRVELYNNNPRIVVHSNDPAEMSKERNFGKITAAMDAPTFYTFLELLKIAYESQTEVKNRIMNTNFDFVDGKRSNEPIHISDTWVGKDKEGCVYLSVVSKKDDKPIIKFIVNAPDKRWHKFFHSDGTQYSEAQASNLYARSYYNLWSNLVGNLLVTEYVEPPPYVPGGGSGSNYRQKPNNLNNIDTEDVPF